MSNDPGHSRSFSVGSSETNNLPRTYGHSARAPSLNALPAESSTSQSLPPIGLGTANDALRPRASPFHDGANQHGEHGVPDLGTPFANQLDVGRPANREAAGLHRQPAQTLAQARTRVLQTVDVDGGTVYGSRRFNLLHLDPSHRIPTNPLPPTTILLPYAGSETTFMHLPLQVRNAVYQNSGHRGLIDARLNRPNTLHAEVMQYRDGGGGLIRVLNLNAQTFREGALQLYRQQSVAIPVNSYGFVFLPFRTTPYSLPGWTIPLWELRQEAFLYAWLTDVPLMMSPRFNPFLYYAGRFTGVGFAEAIVTHQRPDFGELESITIELEADPPHDHFQLERLVRQVERTIRVLDRTLFVRRLTVTFGHYAHWVGFSTRVAPGVLTWTPYRRLHRRYAQQHSPNLRLAMFPGLNLNQLVRSDFEAVLTPFLQHVNTHPVNNIRALEIRLPADLESIPEFIMYARHVEAYVVRNYVPRP